MFAGHVGIGLAIGHAEQRVNVGVFIASALLLDLVLWLFILFGWESVSIPANFASTHQPEFNFPYSHGLLAGVLWCTLAGAVAFLWYSGLNESRPRAAALVSVAVFSHWLLDVLVHRPEMPLVGATSSMFGLGLWHTMPVALVVEALIVAVGLYLFIPSSRLTRGKTISLTVFCFVILAFTVAGMTLAPPPPSAFAMAGSSLATLVAVCAIAGWLGRLPHESVGT